MGLDGVIDGWAAWVLFAVICVRYFTAIHRFGSIEEKHLKDPKKRHSTSSRRHEMPAA